MREKCYFAYCSDNCDENLMEYLKKELEDQSNGQMQVIYDRKDFHHAENFKENEKRLQQSDSVVIFFSPEYKHIIDNQDKERGTYREYNFILPLYQNRELAVIPIIIRGTINDAITRDFKDHIVANFSDGAPILVGRRKIKKVNPTYKTEMNNLISDIIFETSVAHRRKDYKFSNTEEAYQVLFCNTDSKNKLPKGCMYKSEAYRNIMSAEGTSFLVGRKGSGKTTFFEVLEKYNSEEFDKRFKVLRPISVEDIREENLYSVFEKFYKDHKIFGKSKIIELFWEIYIYLCAIYIVCVDEENHRIRDDRRTVFRSIGNTLKKMLKVSKLDSDDVKRAIFTESVALWDEFINSNIIDFATEEAFLASMDANFNVHNVLQQLFTRAKYQRLVKAIERCDKKILVALDKFDAISEDFRREVKRNLLSTNEKKISVGEKQAEFDRLLYRSLIMTVERLKLSNIGIMSKVAFCIIIPQDRIDQIRIVDRDFTKRNFISLSWDAIELLRVVLLRLSVLYEFRFDLDGNVTYIFEEVIQKYMPTIPLKIAIDTDKGTKYIGLFQYILRISFWRPRDIIKYMAVLYDANDKNILKHNEIDIDTLKNHINIVTEDIIKNEFFSEYDKIFFNIADLMNQFEGSNILLTIDDLVEILQNFQFEGVLFTEGSPIINKIKLLYELGVIGLKFKATEIKNKNIGHELCFVFNEGMYPFERIEKNLLNSREKINFILNPIFAKKYSLIYNTSEIICDYSWDYLLSNHIRKGSIDRV